MTLNNKTILTLVAIGFLFYALSDGLPIGYFTLLRFVVCAVSIYLAYETYKENKESLWVWAFGFVAILFNPIIPIVLKRDVWESIDLATGIFFVLSIFLLSKNSIVFEWFKSLSTEKIDQKKNHIKFEKLINKELLINIMQWTVVPIIFITTLIVINYTVPSKKSVEPVNPSSFVKTELDICQEQNGSNASYDKSSNSCGCKTGYVFNGRSCITNNQSCLNSYPNSEWDGTKNDKGALSCNCIAGYGWNKSQTACIPSNN